MSNLKFFIQVLFMGFLLIGCTNNIPIPCLIYQDSSGYFTLRFSEGESPSAVFRGIDKNTVGNAFHYKANCENLRIENSKISFELTHYYILVDSVFVDSEEILELHEFISPLVFDGEFTDGVLVFRLTSLINDSNFDLLRLECQ